MKVLELIEMLKHCDPDEEVRIWSEFGNIDIKEVDWNNEYQQYIVIS